MDQVIHYLNQIENQLDSKWIFQNGFSRFTLFD